MITLGHDWKQLEEFGIRALTGEADRTGTRILCDLTDYGKDIVCDLLGIPEHAQCNDNWNSGANHSVMLPYRLFADLCVWCLIIGKRCPRVAVISPINENGSLRSTCEVIGLEREDTTDTSEWDDHLAWLNRAGFHVRVIQIDQKQPGEGTRATHAMSGRTT